MPRSLRAIIVDDEAAAIKVLNALLEDYEEIRVVGCYTSPEIALANLASDRPDIIFLDIEMGSLDGLTAADLFNRERFIPIVFVTAYSQYAIDAFEVNAIDYMLKPVRKKRLEKTLAKLREAGLAERNLTSEEGTGGRQLRVISLDQAAVLNEDGQAMRWRTRKAKELFFYLWLHRQNPVNKELLIEQLFPDRDPKRAFALLHTTIYQIRRGLAEFGFPEGIEYADGNYHLQLPITSDLEELNRLLGQAGVDRAALAKIIELYKKDFLAGEAYDWANETRIRNRNLVQMLVTDRIRQELDRGAITPLLIACLDFTRRISPVDEAGAGLHLEFFSLQNKKAEMKDYYQVFRQRLSQTLDVSPSEELDQLYEELMSRRG